MATTGFNGRKLTIDWDSTTLTGVRSRGWTGTADHVDITTDDDSGWRKLLAEPGLRSVEVTVAGISSDEVLIAEFTQASFDDETLDIDLPTGVGAATPGKLSGTFRMANFAQTGEHDGSVEFTATFMSDGAVSYTATVA